MSTHADRRYKVAIELRAEQFAQIAEELESIALHLNLYPEMENPVRTMVSGGIHTSHIVTITDTAWEG